MRKKVSVCLTVAGCITVATVWGMLAVPDDAIAAKREVIYGCCTFRDELGDELAMPPVPADGIRSDLGGVYCDSDDFTKVLHWNRFQFEVALKKNGAGRSFFVDYANLDPSCLPAESNTWKLMVEGTPQEWRDQELGAEGSVLRRGSLFFGITGKDEAMIHYGFLDLGDCLTVTRISPDETGIGPYEWTIESKAGDNAFFCGDADVSVPFRVKFTATP